MKRGVSANTVLRIMRIAAGLTQQEVANRIHADQSTVSRIESGGLWVTPVVERRYAEACGGFHIIQQLIEALQDMLERLHHNNRLRLA